MRWGGVRFKAGACFPFMTDMGGSGSLAQLKCSFGSIATGPQARNARSGDSTQENPHLRHSVIARKPLPP